MSPRRTINRGFNVRRPSLAGRFGLTTTVCPSSGCGQIHPHGTSEPAPEFCTRCGAELKDGSDGNGGAGR